MLCCRLQYKIHTLTCQNCSKSELIVTVYGCNTAKTIWNMRKIMFLAQKCGMTTVASQLTATTICNFYFVVHNISPHNSRTIISFIPQSSARYYIVATNKDQYKQLRIYFCVPLYWHGGNSVSQEHFSSSWRQHLDQKCWGNFLCFRLHIDALMTAPLGFPAHFLMARYSLWWGFPRVGILTELSTVWWTPMPLLDLETLYREMPFAFVGRIIHHLPNTSFLTIES